MLIGYNQHHICKYKCCFLGDTQTLLQQKRKNKSYSVLTHRVLFSLCESAITPFGRSGILFALKTVRRTITLCVSIISLRSNKTRLWRIKLPNILMGSWAIRVFFILLKYNIHIVKE